MIPRYSTGRTVLAVIIGMLATSACDDGAAYPTVADIGSLSTFVLTAAPSPYDEIARVDVHIATVELRNVTAGNAGYDTIAMPGRTYNLLDLREGRTVVVTRQILPALQYELRLGIDHARSSITLKDGTVLVSTTPEPQLRWMMYAAFPLGPLAYAVGQEPLVTVADRREFVIDFDLARNIVPLYPGTPSHGIAVLRFVSVADRSMTGTVRGVISGSNGPVAGATVNVVGTFPSTFGEPRVAIVGSDVTDATGQFQVLHVPAGSHTLRALGPLESTVDYATRVDVTVPAGETIDVGTIQLPAVRPLAGTYVARRVGRGDAERPVPATIRPWPPLTPRTPTILVADTIVLDDIGGGRRTDVEMHHDIGRPATTVTTRSTFAYTHRGRLLTLSYPCPGAHCNADPVGVIAGDSLTIHVPPSTERIGWAWPRIYERIHP